MKKQNKDQDKKQEEKEKKGEDIITQDDLINKLQTINQEFKDSASDKKEEKQKDDSYPNINKITFSYEESQGDLTNSTKTSSQMTQPENITTNTIPINRSQGSHEYKNPMQIEVQKRDYKSLQDKNVPNFSKYKTSEVFSLSPNQFNQDGLSRNNILKAFKDQQTTIFLQRIIMGAQTETIDYIINELKGLFRSIIKDKNGNYFCSDLFKVCELPQRIKILEELSPILSEDCTNSFSTHPIQALIVRASSEKEYELILSSFNEYNKFLFAALDPNGAYTIQRIIERIPERYRMQFNLIFTSFIGFISKKKFGIVVVKKFISHTKSNDVTTLILKLVQTEFSDLSVDQYANYLIQYLLEKWQGTAEGYIIKQLVKNNFLAMCQKKYSSFICESYIKLLSPQERFELIQSIDHKEANESTNPHFIKIMKALGIYQEQNFNNFQLPFNHNNNFPPNMNPAQNMMSRFNFVNNNINNFGNFNYYPKKKK